MKENTKYAVGEFSKKTGLSVRTLHYYDEIGLLQPEKDPETGHRIYSHSDIVTLQKILSFKFLGFSLEQIASLLHKSSFTVDLADTLTLHMKALKEDKKRIEISMNAMKRVVRLLKEEGEVESSALFSIIHNIETAKKQKEWMDQHELTEVMEVLSGRSEEEKMALDQMFITFYKGVKQLYGSPVDDPKVTEMLESYFRNTFSFLGEDLIHRLADANVEETDIQEFENISPFPFTEEEKKWLNEAMEYYVKEAEQE